MSAHIRILSAVFLLTGLLTPALSAETLPWTVFSGIVHDNDDHRDVYTDEYLLALASIGNIRLKALTTSYTANQGEYELFREGRPEIIERARRSGFHNLPIAAAGPGVRLMRPGSNRMADTKPIRTEGAKAILEAARNATPARPLIVVTGGPLSTVADAWLMDPSIAERVVVSGVFGLPRRDYNAGLDAWAWAIVVSHFKTLAVPIGPPGARGKVYMKPPAVPKARIARELPQTVEFFRWMFEKKHPTNSLPDEHDFDGQAAIPLMRPDYITAVSRWRVTGLDDHGEPQFVQDPDGPLFVAEDADQSIATSEFWRALNAAARRLR
ncbi:MAG: hypothetical protein ACK5AZ_19625 [Bryobacteraceae bacterium]